MGLRVFYSFLESNFNSVGVLLTITVIRITIMIIGFGYDNDTISSLTIMIDSKTLVIS
jgi:hypothetical protein